jgi:hypothetical protein
LIMAKTQVSAREQAAKDREAAAEAVARLLKDKAEAQLALAEALERSGELILDDPAQIDKLGQGIDQQRRRIDMADRATVEASKRYMAAARDAILAEADELDDQVENARRVLSEFEARKAELVAALVAHTGGTCTIKGGREHVLAYEIEQVVERQRALRANADQVEPLRLVSADLARASLRLLETSGELSDASRLNIEACAAALRDEAEALQSERGPLVYQLREGWLDYNPGRVIAGHSVNEFVVHNWVPDVARVLLENYDRELRAAVPGHLQQNGVTIRPDPGPCR